MEKNLSFLLVDDNAIALKELEDMLKYLGHQKIHGSESAVDAWAILKVKPFDCVFSAWDMPEMSGLAFLKIIRKDDLYATLPFFLADSSFTQPKVAQAGQAGATGLIVKPYELETMKNKMETMAEILGIAPSKTEMTLEEGMKLLESEDYGQALDVFENMVKQGESPEVYYNIGYIKTSQKKYEEAIEAFRKATELDRLFAKAFKGMGRAYKELGQTKEAEESLNKAAEIYLGSEKDEDAEEILNEILELGPDSVNVYNSLGILYRKKGQPSIAIKHYMKALKIHPNEPNIYYNIGRLHVELKNLDKGKFYFKKAITINPGFKDAQEVLNAIELGTL